MTSVLPAGGAECGNFCLQVPYFRDMKSTVRYDVTEEPGTCLVFAEKDSMDMTLQNTPSRQPVPLVLLHGLGQKPDSWKPVMRHLPAYIPVIAPDLESGVTEEDASFERLAASFEQLMESIQGPADIAGLSLGAVVALDYALRHPEKVRSLILAAPQYKTPKTLLRLQSTLFSVAPEKLFASAGLTKPQMLSLYRSMMTLDYADQVPALSCPVLILVGSRDRINRKAALTMTDRVPGARLRMVEGSGHEINADQPERMAAVMRLFLREAAAR